MCTLRAIPNLPAVHPTFGPAGLGMRRRTHETRSVIMKALLYFSLTVRGIVLTVTPSSVDSVLDVSWAYALNTLELTDLRVVPT